jgi:hypothetical protein
MESTNPNNKPDNIICGNGEGTCMLTDVAISGERNVIKKEAEKILKYKDLTIEVRCMWNVKTKLIPVIIQATGTTSK